MTKQKKTDNSLLNPHVSIDCVVFGYDDDKLKVLLIERGNAEKSALNMVLPGDLIRDDEDLDTGAKRILKELTGLENIYLEQFCAFGNPDRVRGAHDAEWLQAMRTEPQARVITIAYYSLIKIGDYKTMPSSFARSAEWVDVNRIPKLAFDHNEILRTAWKELKERIRNHPVGKELLPKKFTLSELQQLYEEILNLRLDKRNFRRKMLNLKLLEPLDEKQKEVKHKPAQLYKFNDKVYRKLMKGIGNLEI